MPRMNHTIAADQVPLHVSDTLVAEFLVRQLGLIAGHSLDTRRELARILNRKCDTQAHFFNACELRIMRAIAATLNEDI